MSVLLMSVVSLAHVAGADSTYDLRNELNTIEEGSLSVPEGFVIDYFSDIPGARAIRATDKGDLLVSSPISKAVYLIRTDTRAVQTLLSGLNSPNGIDLHEGWLYIGETQRVGRIRFDPERREVVGGYETIIRGLPNNRIHHLRALRFGPDDHLYISIGSSCNVCIERDSRHATIMRFAPDGSAATIYAKGLRNSVGFDWHPITKLMYATDNGRDWLGDNFPPCELNLVTKGGFYGWPFANGDRVLDPELGKGHEAEAQHSLAPVHLFRPHNSPLGITFLRNKKLPSPWLNSALVALHGSWNRTHKDGYKVVALEQVSNSHFREHDFVTGFLKDSQTTGRPADIAEMSDGTIFLSDDYSGTIYRISRQED